MRLPCLAALLLVSACISHPPPPAASPGGAGELRQPEGPSPLSEQPGWRGQSFAVATAHPLASAAGYEILKAGGSAVDAAIAAQMVLGLVEPQSSGIGGGAFLLHYDGQQTVAFDGRETAPAAVREDMFMEADGKPMAFQRAVVGGRAVGVPGALRMLEMAHAEYGRLPWARLFAAAIRLAQDGFPVGARLHKLLEADPYLRQDPQAAALYYDADGQALAIGSSLRNPQLAIVLQRIASEGASALYAGEIAQAVVDRVHAHPDNPGQLSLADLAAYRAQRRAAFCSPYAPRGARPAKSYLICGFPPPSSGAIAIAQILGILNDSAAPYLVFEDPRWLHYYSEASRLAFADRAQYVADPDFVAAPAGAWQSLVSPAYLAERARLIGPRRMPIVEPGLPSALEASNLSAGPAANAATNLSRYAPMREQLEHGTTHISVVDAYGNALAMTSSIEDAFGARQMVRGFLLNNELTDFSFMPSDSSGAPIANRVEPGKRPRSSMSPTLVFEAGELVLSGGSPGGEMIIHYTAKLLYATLNWGLAPQQAIDLPNFGVASNATLLEAGRFAPSFIDQLAAHGHALREVSLTSGLQAIQKTPSALLGGADPRREGRVSGE